MANADAPFGFRPINMDGTPYNGATLRCSIAAADTTSTFIGDAVTLDGSSNGGYPGVSQAATTEAVFGVVTAFEADPATSLDDQYRKASTLRYCQVALADRAYFECQSNGADASLPAAASGLNAEFAVTAGDTAYGHSKTEIDAATEATTADLDLQLVMPVDRPDNDVTLANANWIVKFNDPQTATPDRTGV
jgi:hypothetical protein